MEFIRSIASSLNLPDRQVKNTIELLQDGNTIPFIARYRKELTGNLDEVKIQAIQDEFTRLQALYDRRKTVLKSIQSQGKLTESLKQKLLQANSLAYLEDLYRPFRPKRRTRAMQARERGLEPLASMIQEQIISKSHLLALTRPFLTEEVPDQSAALAGAEDIVAEWINDDPEIRRIIRQKAINYGKILVTKSRDAADSSRRYETYYQFSEATKYLQPHQVLAINRGEREKCLKVQVLVPEAFWRNPIALHYPINEKSVFSASLERTIEDCASRLLLPAIERAVRRELTEHAEEHATQVFSQNLRALLMHPPLPDQVILAIDPGFRTGCKVTVIDATGRLLDDTTIYPHPPQNKPGEAQGILEDLIKQHNISLIVIGNGTASRETELLVSGITKQAEGLSYLITSEAGASVYSASQIARNEFPDLDVSLRGAVSIGRRVQDPLAELVKIDPKAIGVGLYQHDINQGRLAEALNRVVESVVNSVGVDLNTASAPLLTYVAGIGPSLAESIVEYRQVNGPFKNRAGLKAVPGMGPKTFEQSAGFLRIRQGKDFLDNTAIHPESYPLALQILNRLNFLPGIPSQDRIESINQFKCNQDLNDLAAELNTGVHTLNDILDELARPGRDPREDIPKPLLRKDVLSMEDLQPGMTIMGTIRNVVDFGAFVDIGVKHDGLLHRSEIKTGSQLIVGDILAVKILAVDHERNRISLSMVERTQA